MMAEDDSLFAMENIGNRIGGICESAKETGVYHLSDCAGMRCGPG